MSRPLHSEGKAMRSRWEGGKQGNSGEQIGGRVEGEITVRTWREEERTAEESYKKKKVREKAMKKWRHGERANEAY